MKLFPLKRGDEIAVKVVVSHDVDSRDVSFFAELGYRSLSVTVDDVVGVVRRKFEVGEIVQVDTPNFATMQTGTVRAVFDNWVVVTVEDGMPPVTVTFDKVERLPPKTAEIFKALTTPVTVDLAPALLAPEPDPMTPEDHADAEADRVDIPNGSTVQF